MTTAVDSHVPPLGELRQRSVGAIEFQDEHGRRKTVHLDEMTEDDRELAEKFGYNPVI